MEAKAWPPWAPRVALTPDWMAMAMPEAAAKAYPRPCATLEEPPAAAAVAAAAAAAGMASAAPLAGGPGGAAAAASSGRSGRNTRGSWDGCTQHAPARGRGEEGRPGPEHRSRGLIPMLRSTSGQQGGEWLVKRVASGKSDLMRLCMGVEATVK
jgi:hypothetical protein